MGVRILSDLKRDATYSCESTVELYGGKSKEHISAVGVGCRIEYLANGEPGSSALTQEAWGKELTE